jgi:hypothetical protein
VSTTVAEEALMSPPVILVVDDSPDALAIVEQEVGRR